MDYHPASMSFPLLEGKAFEEMKTDIATHGLKEPIVLLGGKILDGRNRYRCILEIEDESIQPEFEEYTGDQSPEDYVRSMNLYRRHLTASQRSMNAARARPAFEEEAKKRKAIGQQKGGGDQRSEKARTACASNDAQAKRARKPAARGRASREAGQAAKVSAASVDRARTVLAQGTDELIAMVDRGEVSVTAACRVAANCPKSKQQELAKQGARAIQQQATKLAKRAKPRKGRSQLELIETLCSDLDRLIKVIQKTDRGGATQRNNVIANLRLAKKYVFASANLFK